MLIVSPTQQLWQRIRLIPAPIQAREEENRGIETRLETKKVKIEILPKQPKTKLQSLLKTAKMHGHNPVLLIKTGEGEINIIEPTIDQT